VDLVPPVFLDDGRSQNILGLRNFGKFSLLHVGSAKARAPCSNQTVVDPLNYGTMTIVGPPHEVLISFDLEDLSVFKGFDLFSSYESDSWILSTLTKVLSFLSLILKGFRLPMHSLHLGILITQFEGFIEKKFFFPSWRSSVLVLRCLVAS
jgi:hypothetical protein